MTAASLPAPVARQREGVPCHARSGRLVRPEGAFLAFAAGDALGWPQEIERNVRSGGGGAPPQIEFRSWTRRSGRYRRYEETIGVGEYSDDTQLTLSCAWSCLARRSMSGAATVRRSGWRQAWLASRPPWESGKTDAARRYFDAGGNGVAMGVLPHALFLAGQEDPTVLVHDVVRDGAVSYGHPRALVGATVSA